LRHLRKCIEERFIKIAAAVNTDAPIVSPFYRHAAASNEPPIVVHILDDPFVWEPNSLDSDDDDGQFLELSLNIPKDRLKAHLLLC
jgi:hypothetical protein